MKININICIDSKMRLDAMPSGQSSIQAYEVESDSVDNEQIFGFVKMTFAAMPVGSPPWLYTDIVKHNKSIDVSNEPGSCTALPYGEPFIHSCENPKE